MAEQGKLIDAEAAYKTATALSPPVPCASAEFGITLLREHKTVAAQEQFAHELDTGSHCGMAVLGQAVANVVSGDQQAAVNRLALVANADPAFLRSNLARFRGAITTEQARTLIDAARTKADASSSVELPALIEEAFLSDETSPASNTPTANSLPAPNRISSRTLNASLPKASIQAAMRLSKEICKRKVWMV